MRGCNFWWFLCVAVFLSGSFARAQSQNGGAPLKVTMCDLYNDPQKYAGKMIEVRATIGNRDLRIERPTLTPQTRSQLACLHFPHAS